MKKTRKKEILIERRKEKQENKFTKKEKNEM